MFLIWIFIVSAIIAEINSTTLFNAKPCRAQRFAGGNTIVCKCDREYCDELARISDEYFETNPHSFVKITTDKAGKRFEYTSGRFNEDPVRKYRYYSANDIDISDTERDTHEKPSTNYEDYSVFVKLNRSQKYQSILGFGGAVTDASGFNFNSLEPEVKDKFIRSYVGKTGSEYSKFRVPIGGNDFSTRPYTNQDTPGDDYNGQYFHLTIEDIYMKIPMIKRFLAETELPLSFIAGLWSPPAWMKTIPSLTASAPLRPGYENAFVYYLIKFFKAYEEHGIHFNSTFIVNEAGLAASPWNGMIMSPEHQLEIAKLLYDRLPFHGLEHIGVFAGESIAKEMMPVVNQVMGADSSTERFIRGFTFHPYGETPDSLLSVELMKEVIDDDRYFLCSEYCTGQGESKPAQLGRWLHGDSYAKAMLEVLSKGGSGFLDWNMALDLQGGPTWVHNRLDAPIIVNATEQAFYKQPQYYAIAHITKFIPPESIRIGSTFQGTQSNGKIVAVQTPEGRIVVVATNPNPYEQDLVIADPELGEIKTVLTPLSVNTFVYKPY